LAQAIGRWGNFTNSMGDRPEGYGIAVEHSVPPFTMMVYGVPHISFWLFESVLNFGGFVLLYFVYKKQNKFGTTTATYFIYYGLVRTVLESIRGDVLPLFGDSSNPSFFNRASVVVSLLMIAAGVAILYLNKQGKISQDNLRLMFKEPPKRAPSTQEESSKELVDAHNPTAPLTSQDAPQDTAQSNTTVDNTRRTPDIVDTQPNIEPAETPSTVGSDAVVKEPLTEPISS